MTKRELDAITSVVDGEVIVYWNDQHLRDFERVRSANRERVGELLERDYQRIEPTFTIDRGKFRFHYRKEVNPCSVGDQECYVTGEHNISQEFRSRVIHTRVVI